MKVPVIVGDKLRIKKIGKKMFVSNNELNILLSDPCFGRYYPQDLSTIPEGYVGLYIKDGIMSQVIIKE